MAASSDGVPDLASFGARGSGSVDHRPFSLTGCFGAAGGHIIL